MQQGAGQQAERVYADGTGQILYLAQGGAFAAALKAAQIGAARDQGEVLLRQSSRFADFLQRSAERMAQLGHAFYPRFLFLWRWRLYPCTTVPGHTL